MNTHSKIFQTIFVFIYLGIFILLLYVFIINPNSMNQFEDPCTQCRAGGYICYPTFGFNSNDMYVWGLFHNESKEQSIK